MSQRMFLAALGFGVALAFASGLTFAGASETKRPKDPASYCVYDLGRMPGLPPGETYQDVRDINERDQIVGWQNVSGTLINHGFVWERGRGFRDLGFLGQHLLIDPYAINDAGVIVGGAAQYDIGEDIAFIWTRRAGMQPLDVSLGGVEGVAAGINRRGQIVGASEFGPSDQMRAVLREPNGDVMDLGAFPDGDGSSGASDINDRGQVIGTSTGPITSEGFIWDKRRGMQRLAPSSSLVIFPLKINNRGVVVGETVADETRAFRWTRRTGLRYLPTLTGDPTYSSATGINRWGTIVGSSLAPEGLPHAVTWSRSGIRDLNTVIDPSSPIVSQFVLIGARAINDRSRIAAIGFYPDTQRQSMFLLEPRRPKDPPCE